MSNSMNAMLQRSYTKGMLQLSYAVCDGVPFCCSVHLLINVASSTVLCFVCQDLLNIWHCDCFCPVWNTTTHWHRDTHTHPFYGLLEFGVIRMNWYQKGKTTLDFTEARDSELQWHQLGHMQICTLPQTNNHASTPRPVFYSPDALPAAQPIASKHWVLLPLILHFVSAAQIHINLRWCSCATAMNGVSKFQLQGLDSQLEQDCKLVVHFLVRHWPSSII